MCLLVAWQSLEVLNSFALVVGVIGTGQAEGGGRQEGAKPDHTVAFATDAFGCGVFPRQRYTPTSDYHHQMATALPDADHEELQRVLDLSRAEAKVSAMTEAEQIEEAIRQSMPSSAGTDRSPTAMPEDTLKRSRSPSPLADNRPRKVQASSGTPYATPQPAGVFKQFEPTPVSRVRPDQDQEHSLDAQLELRVAARWRNSDGSPSQTPRSSSPGRSFGPIKMRFGSQNPAPIAMTRGDQAQLNLLYFPAWLSPGSRTQLKSFMLQQMDWFQVEYTRPSTGQHIVTPRYTTAYVLPSALGGKSPGPNQVKGVLTPWPEPLRQLLHLVQSATGCTFNSVLCN